MQSRDSQVPAGSGYREKVASRKLTLTVILITGERLRMTLGQFWHVMSDAHALIFWVLGGLLIGYLYPMKDVAFWVALEWWQLGAAIILNEVVLLLALVTQFVLVALLARRIKGLVVPVSVAVFLSLLALETFRRATAVPIYGPDAAQWIAEVGMLELTARDYVWLLAMEIAFSVFVVPHLKIYPLVALSPRRRRHHAVAAAAPEMFERAVSPAVVVDAAPPAASGGPETTDRLEQAVEMEQKPVSTPDTLWIAGERVDLKKLHAIRAEEHYILLIMQGGDELVRYRIADAVALLPQSIGAQAHRSFWIAFHAVTRCARLPDGRLHITLQGGHEVTVPRARRREIESLLRKYGADEVQDAMRRSRSVEAESGVVPD